MTGDDHDYWCTGPVPHAKRVLDFRRLCSCNGRTRKYIQPDTIPPTNGHLEKRFESSEAGVLHIPSASYNHIGHTRIHLLLFT